MTSILFLLLLVTVINARKHYEFVLMDPHKFTSVVKQLNRLYFPDKKCTLTVQDVPNLDYHYSMNVYHLKSQYNAFFQVIKEEFPIMHLGLDMYEFFYKFNITGYPM